MKKDIAKTFILGLRAVRKGASFAEKGVRMLARRKGLNKSDAKKLARFAAKEAAREARRIAAFIKREAVKQSRKGKRKRR